MRGAPGMSAQAPLLVRIRPRWLPLRNQQALLLPGRSVGHISILSQTFNHIESTFRDPGSNVGIVAPTLGVAAAGSGPTVAGDDSTTGVDPNLPDMIVGF